MKSVRATLLGVSLAVVASLSPCNSPGVHILGSLPFTNSETLLWSPRVCAWRMSEPPGDQGVAEA